MKENTMSAKDVQLSICTMKRQAQYLLNKGKEYEKLLLEILKFDCYAEESGHMASGKELQQKLKIKPDKYKKLIEQIYNDLINSASETPKQFTFSEVEYGFIVKGFNDKSFTFKGHLPIRPVVGEGIYLPFFRPTLNFDHFYVSKIIHYFTDSVQTVTIWLEAGFYNFYENFKEEKDEYEEKERSNRLFALKYGENKWAKKL